MNKIKDFIVENSSGEMFVVGVVMYVWEWVLSLSPEFQ